MARARKTITTNATISIGGSYSPNTISSKVIHLTTDGTWNGSLTIARRLGPLRSDPATGGGAVQPAWTTVVYHDETNGTDSNTALTGTTLNKIISVRADCSEIAVVTTGTTAGALYVDYDGAQG